MTANFWEWVSWILDWSKEWDWERVLKCASICVRLCMFMCVCVCVKTFAGNCSILSSVFGLSAHSMCANSLSSGSVRLSRFLGVQVQGFLSCFSSFFFAICPIDIAISCTNPFRCPPATIYPIPQRSLLDQVQNVKFPRLVFSL